MRSILNLAAAITWLALLASSAAATDALPHRSTYDITPTYDGTGQVVEPDVLYIPGGLNGYQYWMAVTPYPCGNESHENPSILAGNDGLNWATPTFNGDTADAPLIGNIDCGAYDVNNDPSIVFANDSLHIFYMVTHGPSVNGNIDVKRISSADGVHWTNNNPIQLWNQPNFKLSQSVVYDKGTWYMFYISAYRCGGVTTVHRLTSSDGLNWPLNSDQVVTINSQQGYPFHLTVKNFNGMFEMMYVAYADTNSCSPLVLYYAESGDGLTWISNTQPMLTKQLPWESQTIYRSSFLGRYPNIAVWYGASNATWCTNCVNGPVWHEALTSIGDYLPPATITNLDFKKAGTNYVTLRWTAPGDDGTSGHATSYSIRVYTSPITEANWHLAAPISNPPTPSNPGVQDTVKITGLAQQVWYYFAIKTTDDVGNVSWLSNVPCIKLGRPMAICVDDPQFGSRIAEQDEIVETAELRISSIQPNPALDALSVTFTLPEPTPAVLEVIDVAGRRLLSRDVGSTPGVHTERLNLGERIRGGMVFVRLKQAGRTVSKPVAVLR